MEENYFIENTNNDNDVVSLYQTSSAESKETYSIQKIPLFRSTLTSQSQAIQQTQELVDNANVYTSISEIYLQNGYLMFEFANGLIFNAGKVVGDNATINGYNAIQIVEGSNIKVTQHGDVITISSEAEISGNVDLSEYDKSSVVNQKITNAISVKVDKVDGKSLSSNDFTNEFKTKLENLQNYNDTELRESVEFMSFYLLFILEGDSASETIDDFMDIVNFMDGYKKTENLKTVLSQLKTEIEAKIPTKTSQLTNDAGFLKSFTETDPTVPAWAKKANPPTPSEIGAIAATVDIPDAKVIATKTEVNAKQDKLTAGQNISISGTGVISSDPYVDWEKVLNKPNIAQSGSYNDLTDKPTIPSKTSQLTNDSGFITDISGKVDKVAGKDLSTNDYTTTEKNKLSGIANNANNYTHPSHTARVAGLYKTTVDAFGHVTGVSSITKADITALGIPAQDTTYSIATQTKNGLMSMDDKIALDNLVIEVPEVIGVLMVNIINLNNDKVDKVAGKTLSTNDYTTDEKTKLSKIEIEANKYVHPAYTAKSLGLYKFTVDSTGHVNSTSAITKADITALGIPSTNTTYNLVTETTNGIMASSDKVKLNGIESGAQVNVEEIFDVADYLIDSNGEAVSTVSQETYNLIYQAVLDKKQIVLKLKQAMGGIGQSIIITCYTSCLVLGGTIGVGYMSPANMGSAHIIYIGQDLSVTMEIDHLIKDNQIVNSFQNGLMSPAMFAQLTNSLRLKDVTTAASLTSLPVTNYSIKVTLTKTSALSFSQTPNEGQEFMIDVLNSSDTDIVIPMPTATDWQCDDESLEIESGMIRGISIRYVHNKYLVKIG